MLSSLVGDYIATREGLWISLGQLLGNEPRILFVGLVAKDCCFLYLTRPFVTCYLIVFPVEEIAFFQGLLETSYLQFLLFCTLHTNPKRSWCKAMEFKTRRGKVESPDSVHCIQSKGMLLHTVLWMEPLGWKHCFSPYVFVLWKCGWKLWGCTDVLAEIQMVKHVLYQAQ